MAFPDCHSLRGYYSAFTPRDFSVHVLSILALAFIVKKPLRKSAAAVLIYLLGCAVISTPYVITVILNHGLTHSCQPQARLTFHPHLVWYDYFYLIFPRSTRSQSQQYWELLDLSLKSYVANRDYWFGWG